MKYILIAYKPTNVVYHSGYYEGAYPGDFYYSTYIEKGPLIDELSVLLLRNLTKEYSSCKYGFLIYRNGTLSYDTIEKSGISWDGVWYDDENFEADEIESKEAAIDIQEIVDIANNNANTRYQQIKHKEAEEKTKIAAKKEAEIKNRELKQLKELQEKYGSITNNL